MNIRQVKDLVFEKKPKSIKLPSSEWRELSAELESMVNRDSNGRFRRGGNSETHPYVTFVSGDRYVYVLGVLVSEDAGSQAVQVE